MASKAPVFDDENPEWTKEDFAKARPASEVLPAEVLANFTKARGRPKKDDPKVPVSLRLSRDVLEHYKGGGPGWQTRMEDVLRGAAGGMKEGGYKAHSPRGRSLPEERMAALRLPSLKQPKKKA